MSWALTAKLFEGVYKPVRMVDYTISKFAGAVQNSSKQDAINEGYAKIDAFAPDMESEAAELQKAATAEATGRTVTIIVAIVLLIIIAMVLWNG